MGVPGCPEFAACTPSMDKVRMVLILVRSMFCFTGEMGRGVATLMQYPFESLLSGVRLKISGGRPVLSSRPPFGARSSHSDRCGHFHPVISGASMPFLYA